MWALKGMPAAQLVVDQSVVLLILSLLMGAFMVASLGWRLVVPETKHVAKEARTEKEGAARGLHKLLVAYLEESRAITPRSNFQASKAQRSVEDLSADLRDLSELLQINNSSIVTVSVTPSSLSSDLTVIISLLAQIANVFVLVTLSESEAAALEDAKVQSLVQQQLPTVPLHRILLCKTTSGKIALVRQLSPSLHVDGGAAVARSLVKYLRSVVVISEDLAAAAEHSWITLPNGGEPPSDAVYMTVDGVVLIDVPPSLLAADLRPEALASLPRVAV